MMRLKTRPELLIKTGDGCEAEKHQFFFFLTQLKDEVEVVETVLVITRRN